MDEDEDFKSVDLNHEGTGPGDLDNLPDEDGHEDANVEEDDK